MRTPSPSNKPRSSRGTTSRQHDLTEESDGAENEMDKNNEAGVRYITESLIQKLTKQENLAHVNSLNLSLSKDGGKKFRFIENLEKCERLEILNLSHNIIEKVEKLEKQIRLRELNLSHNKISKIEGIEHMQNLKKLILAGNEIEHIPAWLSKKLRSLSILNLKQNKISSLQDVSRLKTVKDLTSLSLADNPIAHLPHYRLYTIFHLRSLDSLDGQVVTDQEREEAHARFNIEEVEKLERDLEKKTREIEELQNQKAKALDELQNRDEMNRSLKHEALQQKKSYRELEREMETKNEILKQKTIELTRACQKHYELEQELAFHKIDAKFEPMGYVNAETMDIEDVPEESPYIGKARYKRNLYAQEGFIADRAQQLKVGKMERDGEDRGRTHSVLDVELGDKEKSIQAAQAKLTELQQEIVNAEQQILKATGELKDLEDAVAQKKISEAEKENLCQNLSRKIQLLNQLREEAQALESQMEWQRGEIYKKSKDIENLQNYLDSLNPEDPRHSHVKAQKAGKEQQLDMMNRQYKELEGRLDEMLSRIAKETEEIKDLEQQLTDGQIAANEALKRDLEAIISGLQEYLESVKGQARQANEDCKELQAEKERLLQRLAELEEERNQLEIVAMDAENMRKEIADLEHNLQEQHELNESLRQAQGDLSAYEAELEAQLKARDAEANQLKEELERRKRLSHMENSALQAELEKDRQALENALTRAQLLEEKESENKKLLSQIKRVQAENTFLNEQLQNLKNQLAHAEQNMIHPEQIAARVGELKRKLQTGVGEIRCTSPSDVLGRNLAELQKQINDILARSEKEKRDAQERQKKLQEEIAALHDKAREAPEDYKRACNKAAEARMQSEKRQFQTKVRQLENEIGRLNEQMKSMEEIQGLADQQLLEADEEREKLLNELQDLENKRKMEDDQAQMKLFSLDKELQELKRAVAISDKMAASELSNAKDQLKSLHGTVLKLNQERTGEMQDSENFCAQAARASRDLTKAEAEIELLQSILKEREKQLHEEMKNADAGKTSSSLQQLEIDRLNHTLRKQRAEIERLKHLLDHARNDNIGEMESLLDEIASLRHALGHQNDYITSREDPFRRRGYWYYVPSTISTSHSDSLSTKDSGVGLQYPVTSSPARHRSGHSRRPRKDESVPPAVGHWVYSPLRHGLHRHWSGDGEDGESEHDVRMPPTYHFVPPPGSVIYTVFPDGAPAPQGTVIYGPPPPAYSRPVAPGTVIYGPPPAGTQIVYGPPPPHFTIPLIPTGVLHCNVPAHHELENEITRLEDIIDHLKSRRHNEKKAKERLQEDIEDLEHQKEIFKKEVEKLRTSAQKRKRKAVADGQLDSLITELELEKSLQHHDSLVEEIECVEQTLLKRRAELREADRLLTEAETQLQDTREKTRDTIERYNAAKKHLSHTESDAEELERRAQETATHLVKADQQLRILEANAKDLEQHRVEQESILKEINSVVSTRDEEFQALSQKFEKMNNSLQRLQADIQLAEVKETHCLQTLGDTENILQEKQIALERINDQVLAQQQEVIELDRLLGQKKEELHLLQDHIDQKKGELKEALRDGEQDVAESRQEIREVRSLLEDLSVQKGELNAQLNEKKAQLVTLKQEVALEEETVQKVLSQISKHKSELKHILQMLQLENNELHGVKLQHDQKLNELEKTQSLLLAGKLEIENLQRSSQLLHGEVDWQKQTLEKDHRELELLVTQMHTLQGSMETLSNKKRHLEETSDELEKKLVQAKKVLAATEECNNTAIGNMEKLESDIKTLQKDIEQLNKQKQSLRQDTAKSQQLLHEKKEELSLLHEELEDSRDQLKLLEQDLRNTTKQRDDLLREQCGLKEDVAESMGRAKLLQEKEERKELQLKQLQRAIEEEEQELSKQQLLLKQVMKNIEHEEEHLKECVARIQDHKQEFEWELANRQNTMEMMNARVITLEEHAAKLEREEKWCASLEEALGNTRHQLSESENQVKEKSSALLGLQKEMEVYRSELGRAQEQLSSERNRNGKRIAMLKEAVASQRIRFEREMEEQKHEKSVLQKRLISVEQAASDNHERAKRLLQELQQLQGAHAEMREQLKSQEELDRRQQEINEAVRAIKSQVKTELEKSLKEFQCVDPHKLLDNMEAVLEANESLQSQLESLKENFPFSENEAFHVSFRDKLGMSRSQLMDEQWRGDALRETLRQHEDRLKAQLHHCMSKQADVLSRGRQQTEGSLHSLKRQVDALDELVSNTSADSSFQSHVTAGAMCHLPDDALHHRVRQPNITSKTPLPVISRSQSVNRAGTAAPQQKFNTEC